MTRINTNVSSMLAQRVLGSQNNALTTSLERLSTGLRLNRGADGPADLIVSESLRAEQVAINAAIGNAQRAEQLVNVAEGGLQEISTLLLELQTLVGKSANEAGFSAEEREANQLEIDSILQTIDRVANSTEFNGIKLLNGNFDYTTSGVSSDLADVTINSARMPNTGSATLDVTVDVLAAAENGTVYLSTTANLDNSDNGSITFEIAGNQGVQQFTFASGTAQADIITAINSFSESLGVSASQASGNTDRIAITSSGYGEQSFVDVSMLEGAANDLIFDVEVAGTGSSDVRDSGTDASVLINGTQAAVNGLHARVASDGFDVAINIDGDSGLNAAAQSTSFSITGGGADFNIAPDVSLSSKVSMGIHAATTGSLGSSEWGYLSSLKSGGSSNVSDGNLSGAQSIVSDAIEQVASMRGRLGAFQRNTLGSTINNLGVTLENTAAAESQIRDTDFAAETAALTRQQILSQASTQALLIANAQPQSVLALLG